MEREGEVRPRPADVPVAAPARRRAARVLYAAYVAAAAAGLLLLVEGLASVRSAFRAAIPASRTAERLYCEYDRELGWISRPNVRLANLFGPGRGVVTNSRRFRSTVEVAEHAPEGSVRAICSGDSFTFGYGVDTGDAWCSLLTALDPRVEAVNMGQGGYGLGQAYLWYRRDGVPIEHALHLLAVIDDVFVRMPEAEAFGYGKPVLALEGEELRARNVPVPRPRFSVAGGLAELGRAALERLASVRWLREHVPAGALAPPPRLPGEETAEVVGALLADLAERGRAAGRLTVLVYLPLPWQYRESTPIYETWRPYLAAEAQRLGILFVDLVPQFRRLPAKVASRLFFRPGEIAFAGSANHYTEEGNWFIATALRARLEEEPAFRALFEPR